MHACSCDAQLKKQRDDLLAALEQARAETDSLAASLAGAQAAIDGLSNLVGRLNRELYDVRRANEQLTADGDDLLAACKILLKAAHERRANKPAPPLRGGWRWKKE